MNLIEAYSLNTGLSIDEPFIYEKYFPIPFDKYVLIHSGGGMPAKLYDYYNDVVRILSEALTKQDYRIIQIGGENDPMLSWVVDLRGKTDMHQTAYLLKRASLVIGNDSCLVHMAASLDTPVIALYGPTTSDNHGPYFGEPNKKILLSSHRKGNKPTFSPQEYPKTINYILPEEVAKEAAKILDVKLETNRESLFFGPKYGQYVIDLIPDTVIAPDAFEGMLINVRLDLIYDLQGLAANLNGRNLFVTTDTPIPLDFLKRFKSKIAMIFYEIKKQYSVEFTKDLTSNGIPFKMFTNLSKEDLAAIKLDFFDYGIIHLNDTKTKSDLENIDKMSMYTLYKTTKFFMGRNKIYLNLPDWEADIPTKSIEENTGTMMIDNPKFLESLDYYYIYNETKQ